MHLLGVALYRASGGAYVRLHVMLVLFSSGPEATLRRPLTGPTLPTRFFATADVDPDRLGRDAGKIAEEVLQHLTTLPDSKVRVTVEVEALLPKGVAEDIQRVVEENCQTLRFRSHGFEKS